MPERKRKREQMRTQGAYRCNNCDGEFLSGKAAMVRHYQTKHPDDPEGCWTTTGQTWSPMLDALLDAAAKDRAALREAENELKALRARTQNIIEDRNELASRLHAVSILAKGV